MRIYLFLTLVLLAAGCSGTTQTNNAAATNANKPKTTQLPVSTYEVVKKYPHDPKAFTQGLAFRDGFLYESTGGERAGESTLRKVEFETGKVVQKFDLPPDLFGEGMTILGDKIYMITWRAGIAYEFALSDFKMLREFSYTGEGWGLTNDGTTLIMSSGNHMLQLVSPENFKTSRNIAVLQDTGKPLFLLNELEYVKGEVWANIWHSEDTDTGTTQGRMPNIGKPNYIARIDPTSGKIVGWIDLAGISPEDQNDGDKSENTLNGIAYDEAGDRIFVTGKKWKNLYEIKLKPKQ
ncbi:MAG TPA: glutaminyl-peptide cyclotransferase [Pyrinomonadaceae bacterium]|nr:glutaminyl-peptide cyclotransferase [Pyrinomonadaceae bacterium]